jgi:hypothetical protein
MRSELLAVASASNESNQIDGFAAFFGDRVLSENAPEAMKVFSIPFLRRMMNVAELAFSEVRVLGGSEPIEPRDPLRDRGVEPQEVDEGDARVGADRTNHSQQQAQSVERPVGRDALQMHGSPASAGTWSFTSPPRSA